MTDVSDKIDELESTIEEQATRIESLEEQLEQQRQPSTTRRAAMKGGGLLAMLGLASQPASASGDLTIPGQVSAQSLSADSLVIGGTLYEEDANSPVNVSGTSSTTYSVSGSYDELVLVPSAANFGFNQLQVNGDTGSNYTSIDNSDSATSSQSQWPKPFDVRTPMIFLRGVPNNRITYSVVLAGGATGETISGRNNNITPPITQFTLSDSGSTNRDSKIRVYGRSI